MRSTSDCWLQLPLIRALRFSGSSINIKRPLRTIAKRPFFVFSIPYSVMERVRNFRAKGSGRCFGLSTSSISFTSW